MMMYSRLIFILTLLGTVVSNIHGLLNTCVQNNIRRSRAKSVALSLRSGAAYTDERLIQNMLKHTEDVKEQITRRVQHWMAIERAQKELFLDGEDENMNGHAAIQRAQAQAEQLSRSVEIMSKEGDDELSLDDNSLRMIEDLMLSIEWYRDCGVARSVEVPLKRNQSSFINRVLLRKNPDNNPESFSQTPTISLNCRVFKHKPEDSASPRKTVVVLTGWGESHVKYSALMYRLYSNGFNVLTYDHRCQGMSSRSMRRDNPQVTDIHRFDDYVDDFLYVYDQVICPELLTGNSSKISLVAHSMGCLVSLKAQMRRKGNLIDRAALVCPMFEPQTPFPARFTLWITRILTWLGRGNRGATGEKLRGPWLPQSGITHCNVRRSAWETLRSLLPDIIVATPSFRFLREILRSSLHFQRKMIPSDILSRFPILVLTAGKDSYVSSDKTLEVVERMKKISEKENVQSIHFEDAYHDVLDEKDDKARSLAISSIIDFLLS